MKRRLSLCLLLILSLLCSSCVNDRSAVVHVEGLSWNGKSYSAVTGQYTEGKTIAKSRDGAWDINEIKEDPTHTFVVARAFTEQALYVADDYTVAKSGKITKAYWKGQYIQTEDFLKVLSIKSGNKITWQTDDNDRMYELYVAYNGCPVATVFKGYLGKVGDKWLITDGDVSGLPMPKTAACYEIPEQYVPMLEKYID